MVQSRLAEVRIQEGESLENALRRFKRKVQQEDIIKEVKAALLLPETGRKETRKGSRCSQAQPQESAQGTERTGVMKIGAAVPFSPRRPLRIFPQSLRSASLAGFIPRSAVI